MAGLDICARDSRCSDGQDVLAIDTSHLCVMARGAVALNGTGHDGVLEAFGYLIECHGCSGRRRSITSTVIHEEEQDLLNPDCPITKFAALPPNALDFLEAREPGGAEDLGPSTVGPRDRSLIVVANAMDDGSALLTDDEDLHSWALDLLANGKTLVYSIISMTFLGNLASCGALKSQQVAAIADGELAYQESRSDITPELSERKRRTISKVMNAIGFGPAQDPGA